MAFAIKRYEVEEDEEVPGEVEETKVKKEKSHVNDLGR